MKQIFLVLTAAVVSFTAHAQVLQTDTSLVQLIQKAFEQNNLLHINKLKSTEVAVSRTQATQYYLPKLSTTATYTHLNDDIVFPAETQQLLLGTQGLLIKEAMGVPFNTALPASVPLKPVPAIQGQEIFKVTSNAQMVLFSGFKASLSKKATTVQEKMLFHQSESLKVSIIKDVWETYDKLALVNSSGKVLEAIDRYLLAQQHFVEKAISNGLATPLERERIQLARQRLILKNTELDGTKKLLIEKLAMLTSQDAAVISRLSPAPEPLLLIDEPAKQRPEIETLDEAIKAMELKRKIELSEYVPKLAAFGQYEWRNQDLSLFDPRWAAGLRLQWNLFDGLHAKNEAKKADLEKEMLKEQKQEAEKFSALAITKTVIDKETADAKITANKDALRVAEKINDLTDKQYKNGLTTVTELLNAVADLEKARQDLLVSYYEQRAAVLSMLLAKGLLLNILQ